jgi:hypothetical protein
MQQPLTNTDMTAVLYCVRTRGNRENRKRKKGKFLCSFLTKSNRCAILFVSNNFGGGNGVFDKHRPVAGHIKPKLYAENQYAEMRTYFERK